MLVYVYFFGHNPSLVSVLDGGLFKWKKENKVVTNKKNKNSEYKLFFTKK